MAISSSRMSSTTAESGPWRGFLVSGMGAALRHCLSAQSPTCAIDAGPAEGPLARFTTLDVC